jgi:hypothetical protein
MHAAKSLDSCAAHRSCGGVSLVPPQAGWLLQRVTRYATDSLVGLQLGPSDSCQNLYGVLHVSHSRWKLGQHGPCRMYHRDGTLSVEKFYANGVLEGTERDYNAYGIPVTEIVWQHGQEISRRPCCDVH